MLRTAGKDFGELAFRQARAHDGVVPVRLAGLSEDRKAAVLTRALDVHRERPKDASSVVDAGGVRIRARRIGR